MLIVQVSSLSQAPLCNVKEMKITKRGTRFPLDFIPEVFMTFNFNMYAWLVISVFLSIYDWKFGTTLSLAKKLRNKCLS